MQCLTSLFFVDAVNVREKNVLSIENFIFLKIIGFNQILLGGKFITLLQV
jgi:hypothetical protein